MQIALTPSQKRGFFILLLLVFSVIGFSALSKFVFTPPLPAIAALPQYSLFKRHPTHGAFSHDKNEIPPLDLNTADSIQLNTLPGIGEKLAGRIVRYREKSGGFHSVEDLKKMYGFSPENFEKARPFLYIGKSPEPGKARPWPLDSPPQKIVFQDFTKNPLDINAADSLSLLELKGVGPFLAGKIVRYRTSIGFFHSLDQLSEVYGIKPENLELIRSQLKISSDQSAYPHLKINLQSAYELSAHAYLSYKEAKILEAYRMQHGPYKGQDDLKKLLGISPETIEKIIPYLDYSH